MNAVYKLNGDADPWGPIGLMLKEPEVRTNRGRMSATVTLSREAEDRSGDIVVLKGMRLDGHRKNPVTLLNHVKEHVVGYCQDQLGAYTVKTVGDKLIGEVYFCQDSQLGLDTFRAVEAKILRGTSIGFLPVAGKVEKRHQRGTVYHESNLIEATITPIGDNEDAIVEAVHKTFGKKPPAPELAAILPGLNYKTVLVPSGWEPAKQRPDWTPETFTPDGDRVEKANTFKTAPAAEVEPQYRTPVFYTCPHCSCEMPPESIYREDDGTTRHGPCRGAVVMKPITEPGGSGTIAVGNHPAVPKTLAAYITSRLTHLRRKAMKPPEYDDPNAPVDDEFLPDDNPDPTADPAAAADPHAAHREVTNRAMGDIMASLYQQYCDGAIDLNTAGKQFKEALKSHAKLKHPGGDSGDGDEFGDDEDDDEMDDLDLGGDDDGDEDMEDDADDKPDLSDKAKKKAEKMVQEIWAKGYVPTMEQVADGLSYIVEETDPDPRQVRKFARRLLKKMVNLPEIDEQVKKHLDHHGMVTKSPADEWAEWERELGMNGTH